MKLQKWSIDNFCFSISKIKILVLFLVVNSFEFFVSNASFIWDNQNPINKLSDPQLQLIDRIPTVKCIQLGHCIITGKIMHLLFDLIICSWGM